MGTVAFDTLKFVEKLQESGFDAKQAKGITEAYSTVFSNQQLVTNPDLEARLAELKYDLLKWIVGLALAQFAMLVGLMMRMH